MVPVTEDVALSNGAVNVRATFLYADLAGSSKLVQMADPDVVGKVIRTYLNAATRMLRKFGGEIRSFDGDRVMPIFMGHDQASKAVNAALGINWAVWKGIRPKLEAEILRRISRGSFLRVTPTARCPGAASSGTS